jgi:hypothetical protein
MSGTGFEGRRAIGGLISGEFQDASSFVGCHRSGGRRFGVARCRWDTRISLSARFHTRKWIVIGTDILVNVAMERLTKRMGSGA